MTPPSRIGAPPLSKRSILRIAETLVRDYMHAVGAGYVARRGLCFDDVFEHIIYPTYEIRLKENRDLGTDLQGRQLLGKFDVEENTAYIDRSVSRGSGDPRCAFTYWHEVAGHGVLQGAWLREQLHDLAGSQFLETTEEALSFQSSNLLERQANVFAANTAAPTPLVRAFIRHAFRLEPGRTIRYIGPSRYTLDVRGICLSVKVDSYQELCRVVAGKINHMFGCLSKECLGYQVEECGLICNQACGRFQLPRAERPSALRPARGLPKSSPVSTRKHSVYHRTSRELVMV